MLGLKVKNEFALPTFKNINKFGTKSALKLQCKPSEISNYGIVAI
jgi:hypothetical protein